MNLEAMIATYIRAELAKAIGARGDGSYSTEPGRWPPGSRSRRAARERIRAVPGHEQIGKGRATVWRVSVEAYRAHHMRPAPAPVAPSVARSDEELADAALAVSGLRPTRARGGR